MNNIELKNIRSLKGMNFFIPDYQRGYRWTDIQAKKLLDDIFEFSKRKKKDDGDFYCLQPIVVKANGWYVTKDGRNKPSYEVIDGQQRLTTLFIILKWLKKNLPDNELFDNYDFFTFNYGTRNEYNLQIFLDKIDNSNQDDEYIDFYYMKKVYDAVDEWFSIQIKNSTVTQIKGKICEVLLGQEINDITGNDDANNVRMIWYEIMDDEESGDKKSNSIDIFTRLNIGKIPLTNAELIKALLLKDGDNNERNPTVLQLQNAARWNNVEHKPTARQLQISNEWNTIEQKLQDDSFWHFLYRTNHPFTYENRIEFVFDLMKEKEKEIKKGDIDDYFTFNKFYEELEDLRAKNQLNKVQDNIDQIWGEVKKKFQTLQEWFDDRRLYHYIGFLIEYGKDINELIKESEERDKNNFIDYLKIEIKNNLNLKESSLKELEYGDANVKKVLLLFNILTVMKDKKADMRFPFNRYKDEKWDIEHICSQTDQKITDEKQHLFWIDYMLECYVDDSSDEKVEEYLDKENEDDEGRQRVLELYEMKQNKDFDKFDDLFKKVLEEFEDSEIENKDNISNLALLDKETNRSYKNAFFPVKRKRIINNDEYGVFVPIATKNVFLKYYSSKYNTDLMKWKQTDADAYLDNITTMLNEFIEKDNGTEHE